MITVGRENLLNELASVAPGLSPKQIVEQANCFVVENGQLMTFNGDVACIVQDTLLPIEGAVLAAPLLELLGKMKEDEIKLEAAEGELIVHGKNRSAGIVLQNVVALPIEGVGKPSKWHPLNPEFVEGLKAVSECAADDQSGFVIALVHVTGTHIEATDNFQIGRYVIDSPIGEAFVRRSVAKSLEDMDAAKVGEDERWIHFKARKGRMRLAVNVSRAEDYPDLGGYLDMTEGVDTVIPNTIGEAIDKAELFLEAGKADARLQVTLSPGRMLLEGIGDIGWFKERRKIDYKGEELQFLIRPNLLRKIAQEYNGCKVTGTTLKVDGGRFKFVTCLQKPKRKKGSDGET